MLWVAAAMESGHAAALVAQQYMVKGPNFDFGACTQQGRLFACLIAPQSLSHISASRALLFAGGCTHSCTHLKDMLLDWDVCGTGGTLVTKQTGPHGKPVNTLYVAKKMKVGHVHMFAPGHSVCSRQQLIQAGL